jgi:hypothetical protein
MLSFQHFSFDWDKVGILQADHLDAVLEPLGKRVRGFYGAQGSGSLPRDTSVAVCTIEKANSLVNKLLEEGRLSELAIIVIDELHMVSVIVAILYHLSKPVYCLVQRLLSYFQHF